MCLLFLIVQRYGAYGEYTIDGGLFFGNFEKYFLEIIFWKLFFGIFFWKKLSGKIVLN